MGGTGIITPGLRLKKQKLERLNTPSGRQPGTQLLTSPSVEASHGLQGPFVQLAVAVGSSTQGGGVGGGQGAWC